MSAADWNSSSFKRALVPVKDINQQRLDLDGREA
jgi:hypothetical protein